MLTCLTKTGPAWQQTCGHQAVALVAFEVDGEITVYPACSDHIGQTTGGPDLSKLSDQELRDWCRQNGMEPAF